MTTNPPADAAKVSIIGAAKSRATVLFQEYARNASYKEDDFVRAVGSFVRNINEALDPLEVEMATLLAAQASQIEALTAKVSELRDTRDKAIEVIAIHRECATAAEAKAAKMREAIRTYVESYLVDERDDPELCFDDKHRAAVLGLWTALDQEGGAL